MFIFAGVFAQSRIGKGTVYGPFKGMIIHPHHLNDTNNKICWEVFREGKLSHYVSGIGHYGNWMKLVNCARFRNEQNLRVMQKDMDVYYEVIEDINAGEELLIWYAENYNTYVGIPIALKNVKGNTTTIEKISQDRTTLTDITGKKI